MSAFTDYCISCERKLDSDHLMSLYCSNRCMVIDADKHDDRNQIYQSDYSINLTVLNDFNNSLKKMDRITENNYNLWIINNV
ncbi:hypothetical protein TPHA_0F00530 [Tetrapisispora phaffii CBS 4417]|uniref:Uncharacterized protein n=1 Tax=Tetrapisispora phaffii (strain ATCC 24235 / CBS 4417 / NBRC 1672 / NRRL Y-8282 / UCD 70-5) TaxID=1071381 RepID=G8BUV8_TETPH|nr:hypothetical protein TPHA_0F00530 [Tetrapisispora phaffii CBS 4417]CCE63540.1 hypothetical protein TPHA_0F00530 [Tetrapisispora phaffii CBS 4417]